MGNKGNIILPRRCREEEEVKITASPGGAGGFNRQKKKAKMTASSGGAGGFNRRRKGKNDGTHKLVCGWHPESFLC